MRTQACREKIHKTAESCGLSPETVAEIDRIAGFVKENPQLCGLTTDAVKPLIKISDPEKQKEAISHVEKTLNRKTPTGGTYKKKLTKPEIEKIVEKVLPSEKPKSEPRVISPTVSEIKPKPASTSGSYQPGELTRTNLPPQPSLAAQQKAKEAEVDANGFFVTTPAPADPIKAKSALMEELAEELLALYPQNFQTTVTDIIRAHNTPTSKYGVKDAFYYGIQALAEKKKP